MEKYSYLKPQCGLCRTDHHTNGTEKEVFKITELQLLGTDWWTFGATIFSGVITALATMGAVIYTNQKSNAQLKKQEEKYALDRKVQFQQSKYVVLKPTLLLMPLFGLLDRLIVQNDYNRVLLYSGEDGFEFFDDDQKRSGQKCRLLLIENKTDLDVKEVSISTETILRNMNTDEHITYTTKNCASFLRGHESIVIRLANQQQYEMILSMNEKNLPSLLTFECVIEYLTLANQRIKYVYRININNDRRIEVKSDGIELVQDDSEPLNQATTIFRNLQDYISGVDRNSYAWEKMGQAQMRGIMSQYNPQNERQSTAANAEKQ